MAFTTTGLVFTRAFVANANDYDGKKGIVSSSYAFGDGQSGGIITALTRPYGIVVGRRLVEGKPVGVILNGSAVLFYRKRAAEVPLEDWTYLPLDHTVVRTTNTNESPSGLYRGTENDMDYEEDEERQVVELGDQYGEYYDAEENDEYDQYYENFESDEDDGEDYEDEGYQARGRGQRAASRHAREDVNLYAQYRRDERDANDVQQNVGRAANQGECYNNPSGQVAAYSRYYGVNRATSSVVLNDMCVGTDCEAVVVGPAAVKPRPSRAVTFSADKPVVIADKPVVISVAAALGSAGGVSPEGTGKVSKKANRKVRKKEKSKEPEAVDRCCGGKGFPLVGSLTSVPASLVGAFLRPAFRVKYALGQAVRGLASRTPNSDPVAREMQLSGRPPLCHPVLDARRDMFLAAVHKLAAPVPMGHFVYPETGEVVTRDDALDWVGRIVDHMPPLRHYTELVNQTLDGHACEPRSFGEHGLLEQIGRVKPGRVSLCQTKMPKNFAADLAAIAGEHGYNVDDYVPATFDSRAQEASFLANESGYQGSTAPMPSLSELKVWAGLFPVPPGDPAGDVQRDREGVVSHFLSAFREGRAWDCTQHPLFAELVTRFEASAKHAHVGFIASQYGCATKGELIKLKLHLEVAKVAMCRIVLCALMPAGYISVLDGVDFVRTGLRSPVMSKIKDEPVKRNKVYGPDGEPLPHRRQRSILVQDSPDFLVVQFYHRTQNKHEVRVHQHGEVGGADCASRLPSCSGIGVHDDGVERFAQLHPSLLKGPTFSCDCKGWDWSFPWFMFVADGYRRILRLARGEHMGFNDFMNGTHTLAYLLTLKVYFVGDIVVRNVVRGILDSGIYSTAATNSACRSLVDCFVRDWVAVEHATAGDDYIGKPFDPKLYARRALLWGVVVRDVKIGAAEFCSHLWEISGKKPYARFLNTTKSLARVVAKGKTLSADQYCGLRWAARNAPDVDRFYGALEALAGDLNACHAEWDRLVAGGFLAVHARHWGG